MNNVLNTKIAFGWSVDTNTHALITRKAIDAVKVNCPESNDVFNYKSNHIIINASQLPDYEDEKDYVGHYYSPVTKQSYKESELTGKTAFIAHAKRSVELYKNGQTNLAFIELGKAGHFLQDATQPYHVSAETKFEKFIDLIPHAIFEAYVGFRQKEYNFNRKSSIVEERVKPEDYEGYLSSLFESTAEKTYEYSETEDDSRFTKGEKLLNFSKLQSAKFFMRFWQEAEHAEQSQKIPTTQLLNNHYESANIFTSTGTEIARVIKDGLYTLTRHWVNMNRDN